MIFFVQVNMMIEWVNHRGVGRHQEGRGGVAEVTGEVQIEVQVEDVGVTGVVVDQEDVGGVSIINIPVVNHKKKLMVMML